jgi:hypothetical protein
MDGWRRIEDDEWCQQGFPVPCSASPHQTPGSWGLFWPLLHRRRQPRRCQLQHHSDNGNIIVEGGWYFFLEEYQTAIHGRLSIAILGYRLEHWGQKDMGTDTGSFTRHESILQLPPGGPPYIRRAMPFLASLVTDQQAWSPAFVQGRWAMPCHPPQPWMDDRRSGMGFLWPWSPNVGVLCTDMSTEYSMSFHAPWENRRNQRCNFQAQSRRY